MKNTSNAIVAIRDVHKEYLLGKTRIPALKGVSFEIGKSEFLSIVGPSGCGKSTLLNIIGCIDKPTQGTVLLNGQDVVEFSDDQEAHARLTGIGFIFQSFNLVSVLNVRENIELPMRLAKVPKPEREATVDRLVAAVGLTDYVDHKPDELSGGQRQRVAIARSLVNKPALVIADEPTANLDSVTSEKIMELMRDLNEREGVTFIFSTHNELIERYAKRIITLRDGLIVDEKLKGGR